ncbi:ATP-dependent endonuclease [Streptomyces sp. TRM68367]|uniref:ATP-dependent nuclease n=1 Tax=Streptomyces sp. TRM68367 TaxID=2758415 RepID=UPI00165A9C75|nr:AAA family ATPase [Streptomyces sp. TRM68367]MBC9728238.1 AAA family ATPase [Streptomyces sp. TRM68367]
MQLRRLRIRNFRNFRDLVIDPFPTPAVIVGENGVGKSNLLHALRLVLDPDLPDRRRHLQAEDVHDGSPTLAEGAQVVVEVELADFDDDPDARSELDGAIVSVDPLVARLTYLFRPKQSPALLLGEEEPEPLTPNDYEWTIFGGTDPSNTMLGAKRYAALSVLPALRDAESDFARPDRSPLTSLLRELPPSQASIDKTLEAMRSAREELGRDANVQQIADLIRKRVVTMAGPRLNLDPSLAFVGRDEDLLRSIRLFIDASAARGVDRTSTGTANVLYLALLLEWLRLRRGAVDGADTLLAVEEPEAHLHPTLQRHLFAHLLSEPNRLLLTTHSPHIAAVTPLPSMVLLLDAGTGTEARVMAPDLLTSRERADLERYVNVNRAEILFAQGVVLVEGVAETYLLPALARAAGFDLDAHGIVVASIDSSNFTPYAKLLGPSGFNRVFSMLTDGDAVDTEEDEKYRREPGLTRAVDPLELLANPTVAETFDDALDALLQQELPADGGARQGRQELVVTAAGFGVFVGPNTLETDIAPLLNAEMQAAFNDLVLSPRRRRTFGQALQTVALGRSTPSQRDALISRIERDPVSKGRFAQRLAAHVEGCDVPARVRQLLGHPEDQPVSTSDLLALPGCGPLLALLDGLRRRYENLPLAPTAEEADPPQAASPEPGA